MGGADEDTGELCTIMKSGSTLGQVVRPRFDKLSKESRFMQNVSQCKNGRN